MHTLHTIYPFPIYPLNIRFWGLKLEKATPSIMSCLVGALQVPYDQGRKQVTNSQIAIVLESVRIRTMVGAES